MHSSTSSSNTSPASPPAEAELERDLPSANLVLPAIIAVGLMILATTAWESHVRDLGYAPSYNDSSGLWAHWRSQAVAGDGRSLVIIGASRAAYDIDLDVVEKVAGQRPIQLATVGSNAAPIFWDLAEDPSFNGTVIYEVTPGLFFAPEPSPPFQAALQAAKYYHNWSPSQRVGQYLASTLESQLALLNTEDLSLAKLLEGMDLADRTNAHIPPSPPPQFGAMDARRRLWMTHKTETDHDFQALMKACWYRLETPPPRPPIFSAAQWEQIQQDARNALLARTAQAVQAIQQRGGHVVFLRLPSTGKYREIEKSLYPRDEGWERILAETGAPGLHFEDYPELQGFDCPEESHLKAADATVFTQRLMPLLAKQLAATPAAPADSKGPRPSAAL